ncbi:restriction endonuclease [Pseudoalteromonas aurantia]|uniref:phosphorothioated DNA-binding restriction endonuclease n=1 Tax=Pseudoalteromonas aurantia TaxID=43654 RepID=UPI00110B2844|nr:HNH endonuclease [Pseudoalteromonas aurantia]TMO64582.1 restriction endonuclease [Pseudoalteromonas aurantia]
MTANELRKAVLGVKRWSRADQRAPNKPLMMAYTLANYINGHGQMFSFEDEVEHQVNDLLKRFGPSRKSYHSLYPFWRLINDGFWRLDNAEECLPRKSNTDPPKSELIKYGVTGGFNDEAYQLLKNDTQLAMELLNSILSESFPESIIPEITSQLGLEFTFRQVQKRDPNFRREVLNAYNGKCAICGFDARLNDDLFALEAAHIKWKQFNGPCSVNNGLALCSIHHKALDKGAITITNEMRVQVSSAVNGGGMVEQLIWDFDTKQIQLPRQTECLPLSSFYQWHFENVFM